MRNYFIKTVILFFLLYFGINPALSQGHFPSPPGREAASTSYVDPFKQIQKTIVPDPLSRFPNPTSYQEQTQRQNQAILEEVMEHEQRRVTQQTYIMEYTSRNVLFPDFRNAPGASHFLSAYDEINGMLNGERPLSVKRAIFLSENAFFENSMEYDLFDKEIQHLKNLCLRKMKEEGWSRNDNLAKIMMIFRVMTDEVEVKDTEGTLTHYPMKYDFNDYMGKEDRSQIFVSKLLVTNTGQCHSLPLLFMILAEELDAEAFLSFSPEHMYVKFQDKKGSWHNIELTRGALVSDDFYMSSGLIKAEALRNRIYMNPLTRKEIIAHILGEAGQWYALKYGYDDFVKECMESSLSHYPNNIHVHNVYSNYHTVRALHAIYSIGAPSPESLPQFPQVYELYKRMLSYYEKVDSLGYESMPEEMYQRWLQQIEVEKTRPENQPSPFKQIKQ